VESRVVDRKIVNMRLIHDSMVGLREPDVAAFERTLNNTLERLSRACRYFNQPESDALNILTHRTYALCYLYYQLSQLNNESGLFTFNPQTQGFPVPTQPASV